MTNKNEKESIDLKPLKKVLESYDKKQKNLIPILQNAQNEYVYIPKKIMHKLGKYLKLTFAEVYGVVTFYSQFHLEPRGENIIRVCMGTACHVRGAGKIFDKLKEELGINDGETTEDLQFTLETVACIGACGLAPVIMVNDDTHGKLTPEDVPKILEKYRYDEVVESVEEVK